MKTINLVVNHKGGIGKSMFSFLYGEKHRDEQDKYIIYDADKKNHTTSDALDFLPIKKYDFYTEDDINDQAFFQMIEKFSSNELPENILVDCSATVSESLIKTLKNINTKDLFSFLRDHDMILNFYVIISGGDTFRASMEYLEDLTVKLFSTITESRQLNKHIKIIICKNEYKTYDAEMKNLLKDFGEKRNVEIKSFYLTRNTGKGTEEVIKKLMDCQLGIKGLSPLIGSQFKKGVEDFDF